MRRYVFILAGAAMLCLGGGCGEDQPNAAAKPEEVNADFAQKTTDMMKAANANSEAGKTSKAKSAK